MMAALIMAGCEITIPISGHFAGGVEAFAGVATASANRDGVLDLESSQGRKFKATFVYETCDSGRGSFTFDDGRSGPFWFVSSGTRGTGIAVLRGQRVTFTFAAR
jgi:hypothetical protein